MYGKTILDRIADELKYSIQHIFNKHAEIKEKNNYVNIQLELNTNSRKRMLCKVLRRCIIVLA